MATNGDGSIILKTKVDTSGLNSSFKSMKGVVSKIGGLLGVAFSVKAVSAFAKETKELYKIQMQNEVKLATVMRQRMQATDEEIQSLLDLASAQQELGIIGDEVQIAGMQQIATFAKNKESIEALLPAMNNLIAQQYGFEASAESARNVANLMGKALQGNVGALTRVGITFDATEEAALKTGNEMERAAALAKIITNNVGEMNQALAQTDVGRQQQLANTFGDIKEQFGAAFTQISILFLPALQFLARILATIANLARAAASAIAKMFGKDVAEPAKNTQTSISGAVDGMEDLSEATKKTAKEAKKAKAQFDEIEILSSGSSGGDSSDSGDALSGAVGGGSVGSGFNFGIQKEVGEIDSSLSLIMGIAGEALVAIGLLLLFYGQIWWGIGFIIAGAVAFTVAVASASEFGYDGIINMLVTIMGVAGGALLALGIILLWIGGPSATTIGMIVAGSALIVSAIVAKAIFSPTDIKGWLALIMGIAGGALLALGVVLCYFGCVPMGVGMIIAGAVSLVSAFAINSNALTDKIKGWVAVIMALAGGALLVLGIILTCSGNLMLGIPLIAVGAVSLVTPIALNWNEMVKKISKFFKDCAGLVVGISLALLALGVILCCCGIITPLSIGLIVVGATGIVSEVTLNWNATKESVSKFFKENAGLIVGVSLALLVLGVILCCTGVALPLGIGLIVVGAAGLATEATLNWGLIKEKVSSGFDAISKWVTTWGILILGIILVLSGVGIPLGIALMIKGGQNLAEAQDPLWETIIEKVKYVWDTIKAFWNTHIAKWFTKEHWKGLGKNIVNGLIEAVEKGLNFIIDKINTLSWDVPDWVPGIGGKTWGFNFSNIKIPRLATGAVIPPNREFLAVLGDQKHGTNIEAPLQTIVDAFNTALAQNGNASGGKTEVVLEIDGREFGRAVVEQGNRENRRIGTRLVIA